MTMRLREVLLIPALASVFVLPWTLSGLAALALALWVPLAPLSAGILFDALYFAPHVAMLPFATVLGALASAVAYFVRGRLSARTMS